MKHLTCCFITIFLFTGFCFARVEPKHEISLSAGTGWNRLYYSASAGKPYSLAGGSVGLGYSYYFHDNWGISTGLEGIHHNTVLKIDNLNSFVPGLYNREGERFDFYSEAKDFHQTHKTVTVRIPVMLIYQVGEMNKFYISAGFQTGFLIGHAKSRATFVNKAYFPANDSWITDQTSQGFGTFEKQQLRGRFNYKNVFSVCLETGIKAFSGHKWYLYSGIYGEYGLNRVSSSRENKGPITPFEEYTRQALNFTDYVRPIAIGIKLRFAFARGM